MVLRGLALNEQYGLTHKLAMIHVEAVSQVFATTGRLWSHYAPECTRAFVCAQVLPLPLDTQPPAPLSKPNS